MMPSSLATRSERYVRSRRKLVCMANSTTSLDDDRGIRMRKIARSCLKKAALTPTRFALTPSSARLRPTAGGCAPRNGRPSAVTMGVVALSVADLTSKNFCGRCQRGASLAQRGPDARGSSTSWSA